MLTDDCTFECWVSAFTPCFGQIDSLALACLFGCAIASLACGPFFPACLWDAQLCAAYLTWLQLSLAQNLLVYMLLLTQLVGITELNKFTIPFLFFSNDNYNIKYKLLKNFVASSE